MVDRAVDFFVSNWPTWGLFFGAGPLFLLWSFACLGLAGYLRCSRGVHTGYTRKVFHFLIFGTSVVVQMAWGTQVLCLFGGTASVAVMTAVWLGSGNPLFEALARQTDAPHRRYYVVVSFLATLIGGLLANICFGHLAVMGYLVAGLGDALGEPVGTRFGRHSYCFGFWPGGAPRRTWEGSFAVFVGSAVAASVAALLLQVPFAPPLLATGLGFGVVAALVEGVAPHGWDNAALQFVPTFLAWLVL